MELHVKENTGTELSKPSYCRRPLGRKQVYIYLVHTNKPGEAFGYRECGFQRGEIKSDD